MEAGEKIRSARQARGWSQADLAERVGVSQPAIKKIEAGTTSRSRYLAKIAQILNIDLADLDPGLRMQPAGEGVILKTADLVGDKDLPVYASAEAGIGQLIVHIDPIDWVKRPAPLFHVKGGYGLIVTGESMEPELWSGDIALIHPHLPPASGATFVFYAHDPAGDTSARIKHLLRFTTTEWVVRQWNPLDGEKRDFRLSRREWPICHRVIGKYSRR